MNLITECRTVVPLLVRDGWRKGSQERMGRLFTGGALLFVGIALAALTAAILGVQDEQLRLNVLNLLAALVVLGWLAMMIVLRFELSRHLDVRPLLPLPVGFGTLFALRTVFGLSGLWLPLFAPLLLYLLVARTAGPVGALVALLATVAVVVLLGRLVALLLNLLGGINLSWAATLALLAAVMIAVVVFEPVVAARVLDQVDQVDRSSVGLLVERIRDSRLLEAAGYLPGGVLVAVFEAPRDLWGNVLRLAVLWGAAAIAMLLDYLVLKNGRRRPRSHSGALIPLVWVFRRVRRLKPAACLGLLTLEGPLRLMWMRVMVLLSVVTAAVVQDGRVVRLLFGMLLILPLLNMRANLFGIAHRSLGELLLLPVRPMSHATGGGVALTVIPAGLLAFSIAWAWQRLGWLGWPTFILGIAFSGALLVGGLGVHLYLGVRWPYPYDLGMYTTKLPSRPEVLFVGVVFMALALGVPTLLEFAAGTGRTGETLALVGGAALILASFPACLLLIRAADRRMATDPYRVLETLAKDREKAGEARSTA